MCHKAKAFCTCLAMVVLAAPASSQSPPWLGNVVPAATSASFVPGVRQYVLSSIASCPVARHTSIFFSLNGDDTLGDGSYERPYRSIAKANQVLALAPQDTAICLRRGDTFYSDTGLLIASPHITVCSYGDNGAMFSSKPRISCFRPPLSYSEWTSLGGGVFSAPVASDVSWVRLQEDNKSIYRRCLSLADCNAIQGSWFYDATMRRLYVHNIGDVPLNVSEQRIQYVLKNKNEGITIQDVDDVRIDGIVVEGFGAGTPGDVSYPGYGIDSRISGSMRTVVTNCDVFYNGRHNITKGTGSGVSGGSLVVANCTFGATINDGINIVSYAPKGDQELIAFGNKYFTALLPTGYNSFPVGGTAGSPTLVHTGGGASYSGRMISLDEEIVPGQFQIALLPGAGNMPPTSSIAESRAVVIGLKARSRYTTSEDQMSTSQLGVMYFGLGAEGMVFANCDVEVRCLWCKYLNVHPLLASAAGYWINSKVLFDFSNAGNPFWWSRNATAVSSLGSDMGRFTAKFYFCDIEFRYIGSSTTVGFSSDMLTPGYSGYRSASANWRGCLKGCRVICEKPGNGDFKLAFANDGVAILGNQYPPGAVPDGVWGFSSDAWAIPGSLDSGGGTPPRLPGDILIDGLKLEYDRTGKLRSATPTVGSTESD